MIFNSKTLCCSFLIGILFPNVILAYTPLVSDSPLASAAQGENLQEFLVTVFNWGIGLAVALAILFIIFGGIQYMTTDAISGKKEGRDRITAAVVGLLIALSSWLILNQINPKIFKNNLTLAPLPGGDGMGIPLPNNGNPGTPGGNNPPTYSIGGSVDGIPYGGAYNPTLDSAISGHNGIENLAQIKTDSSGNQYVGGTMSTFGGPNDAGVRPNETGAITGENLRSLDPNTLYIAGRWNYSKTSQNDLQNRTVTVYNPTTNKFVSGVRIVDWGPNPSTGRTWDVSPGVANSIGANTNEEVWVRFD